MEEEAAPEAQPRSLFPISSTSNAVVTTATPSQWLYSSSFTTDISVINAAVVTHTEDNDNDNDNDNHEDEVREEAVKPAYEILESSESEKNERDKEKRKKKSKKKRKRQREESEALGFGARKSGVRAWDNSDIKTLNSKNYYFDSHGDLDNLAFGCLYRMDIGQYKLYDAVKSAEIDFKGQSQFNHKDLLTRGELDVDGLDTKLKSSGRYWSTKHSVFEKQRNFKRIRIVAPHKHMHALYDDYIPLLDEDDSSLSEATVMLESWEDEVLRKTKEFNKKTREQPHNVKVWLDFAEFQDKIASNQPQKGARLQTLEKKISILEKAAELNPEDEDVLLCLLKTYQNRDSAYVLISRWEKVLMQHSGSCKLWGEFLRVVQGDFSTFKVSELRRMYSHAIKALYATLSKRHRQIHPTVEASPAETVETDLELGIVDIYFSLCRFEWQAGYQELATALLQAEIEYALFSPPLQLTEQSKKRLFEHFWNSNAARVGEAGALGWCTWLAKEEENRQKLMQDAVVEEEEQGGWTGWFVPPSKGKGNSPNLEEGAVSDAGADNDVGAEEVDEQDNVNVKQEDDTDLMRMLGIDVDSEASKEVYDTNTWVRWSEEESSRDNDQWMPVRVDSGVSRSMEAIEDEQEQLSRVILFEDVSDFIFSLSSANARLYFVLQFIDFFGGEMSHWFCTNSSLWNEKLLGLETLPPSMIQYFKSVNDELFECGSVPQSVEFLSSCSKNVKRTDIMKFLRNAALLCLKAFPRNYKIEEAILFAEEQSLKGIRSLSASAPSQALAKKLLKSDRQDVLLCGVYARREAAFGNIGHARKVFDLALTSISGVPLEMQSVAAPLLYLWYSEMELMDGYTNESESTSRALHILSCLGNSLTYTPYKGRPSSTQLLKAHQGFKERLLTIRSARHLIDESTVAIICTASLFEELTTGWVAGVEVISDALSMVLPESKSRSYQIEFLSNFQLKMLQKHLQQATPSKVLKSVSAGLQVYPYNPDIFRCLLHLGHNYIVPSKLRLILDELFQRKPSVILCVFSLSYEFSRGASQHRIHGLFERALANDRLHSTVLLWRCYISYEIYIKNFTSARRVFFRAIHACPWSKMLWLDGFQKLHNVVTAKELLDLQKVMQEKELNLRTDIYEILLQDEFDHTKYTPPDTT